MSCRTSLKVSSETTHVYSDSQPPILGLSNLDLLPPSTLVYLSFCLLDFCHLSISRPHLMDFTIIVHTC